MTKPKFLGGLGFRDLELFNLALLARQGWWMLQHPDTLSARMLKAIYFPDGDFMQAELGSHPSKVWRAILEGREVLAAGLIRRIGTGMETNAWEDNWLPRDGAMRPFASRMPVPPQKVADYIDQVTRQWDRQKLNTFFQPVDVQVIMNIPVSTRVQSDFWAWHYDKKGIFSVRSAYRMLSSIKERREAWLYETASTSDHAGLQKSWARLWQVKVPAKVKTFLWRLARHSLPTGDLLHHRHIAQSSSCGICGAEDSWRHSLIDCTMARCVWALADEELGEHVCQMQEGEARSWLFSMFQSLPHEQLTRLCVTLWAIWHARRKAIHEGVFQSPLSTHCFIDNFIADLSQGEKHVIKKVASPPKKHPRWISSQPGVAKINVDAGVTRDGCSGAVAAVARSANGAYMGASAVQFMGTADPEVLEAMAVREGLNLALDLNLQRLKVASDCQTVIKALHEYNLGVFSSITREIKKTAEGFGEVAFVHENRASNMEPHNLARLVLSNPSGRFVWLVNPPDGVCIPQQIIV
jgi:ribonuclease HI